MPFMRPALSQLHMKRMDLVSLTYRVLHGFDKLGDQEPDQVKSLKYTLHPDLRSPSAIRQ